MKRRIQDRDFSRGETTLKTYLAVMSYDVIRQSVEVCVRGLREATSLVNLLFRQNRSHQSGESALIRPQVIVFLLAFASMPFAAQAESTSQPAPASASTPAPMTPTSPVAAAKGERNKIEELFIWKASEELKLPPKEEQAFTDIIRELNSRRRVASEQMEAANRDLETAKTAAEADRALKTHRAVLKDIQAIQMNELDRLGKLLGPERLARYIVVKNSLTERLKNLISAPQLGASPSQKASTDK